MINLKVKKFFDIPRDSKLFKKINATFHYSELSFLYNHSYSNHEYEDLSFSIFIDHQPLIACAVTLKNNELSFFGQPFNIFIDESNLINLEIENYFKTALVNLLTSKEIKKVNYKDNCVLNRIFINYDQFASKLVFENIILNNWMSR